MTSNHRPDEEEDFEKEVVGLEDISGKPLSEIEIKRFRKFLEKQKHKEWLMATAWVWSRSILITVGSIYFVREWLGEILGWISKVIK